LANYYIRLDGPSAKRVRAAGETIANVKAEAVRHLGSVLVDNPGFAEDGHWRLFVEDEAGVQVLQVIVAMIAARGSVQEGDDQS